MAKSASKGPKGPKSGKPKNPKTKATVPGASGAVTTDHNSRLTPDDERRLFLNHRTIWQTHQNKQKLLDEQRTKIVANLKGDGFKVKHMDIADALGNPKGEKRTSEEVQDRLKVAKWIGHPMGNQLDLFGQPDRTPSVDRAFDEGKQASMENKPCKPPYAPELPQYKTWMAGYAMDQERLQGTVGRGQQGGEPVAGERVSRAEFKQRLQQTSKEGAELIKDVNEKTEGQAPAAAPGEAGEEAGTKH